MGRRKFNQVEPKVEYFEPRKFIHNEWVGIYFVQVCGSCGVVTLEQKKGPDFFLCWLCLFRINLFRKGIVR
jgi:hypothetical protein